MGSNLTQACSGIGFQHLYNNTANRSGPVGQLAVADISPIRYGRHALRTGLRYTYIRIPWVGDYISRYIGAAHTGRMLGADIPVCHPMTSSYEVIRYIYDIVHDPVSTSWDNLRRGVHRWDSHRIPSFGRVPGGDDYRNVSASLLTTCTCWPMDIVGPESERRRTRTVSRRWSSARMFCSRDFSTRSGGGRRENRGNPSYADRVRTLLKKGRRRDTLKCEVTIIALHYMRDISSP